MCKPKVCHAIYIFVHKSDNFAGVYGSLNLHGITNSVYWTQLSSTVDSGATSIALHEPVDWEVGSQIVVATTSYDSAETEVVVVASVGADGLTLDITPPLQYHHLGRGFNINYHIVSSAS